MATKKTTSKPTKSAPAPKKPLKKASSPSSKKPVVPPKPVKKSVSSAKKQAKPAPKKPAPKKPAPQKAFPKKAPAKPSNAQKPIVPPKPAATKKSAPPKASPKKPSSKPVPLSKKTTPAPQKTTKPAPKPLSKTKTQPVLKSNAKPTSKPAPKPAVKPIAKKPAPKPVVKPAAKPAAKPVAETVPRPLPPPPPVPRQSLKAKPLTKEELATFRRALQDQLSLKQGNLQSLTGDHLGKSLAESSGDISIHSTHMADHGTDNFARDLALTLAGNRCDDVREIEEAIRRIDENHYGYCELCDKPIGRERLRAHPFARCCILCQSLAEQGKPRGIRFSGPPTIMPPHQDADSTESQGDSDQSDSAN